MIANPFRRYFRTEPDPEQEYVAEAAEVLAWIAMPYHEKFKAWLEAQIDKPLPLGEHLEAAVIRQNTLKEIRAHLRLIETRANARIQEERPDAEEAP